MTYSMTAFSREQSQVGQKLICWEIKSVNHRYLEASFRLPDAFRALEGSLREILRGKLNRGKLDCQLKVSESGDSNQSIVIHDMLVNTLLEVSSSMTEQYDLPNDWTVSKMMGWPGVMTAAEPDIEQLGAGILHFFENAIEKLLTARKTEGDALSTTISTRLALLDEEVGKAKQEALAMLPKQQDKLQTKLEQLNLTVDKSRIEQEIALILTRLDVSEELDRLKTHISEVSRILHSQEPAGRRLDFLMQELNREANTLSSKSDSASLTRHAVEMKVLIEQMREQIQNIE